MSNCLNCDKNLIKIEGKRDKKFCSTTCRSNFWQKKQRRNRSISVENEGKRSLRQNKPQESKKIIPPANDTNSEEKGSIGSENASEVYILEYCSKCVQMTNHLIGECQKCKIVIPPIPIREEGENSFDYASRKNEWKKKYNQ